MLIEAHDLDAALSGLASSEEPFDAWFREHISDVHGIELEGGIVAPERVLDYRAPND